MKYALKTAELFDFSHTVVGDFLQKCDYPWQALPHVGDWILAIGATLEPDRYDRVGESIWIAKSAKVAPTASIAGPCIIGEEAEVRHCAFIRGNALVGNGAVVGNSTELKNAILFDGVQVPHFNYVGDSILGYKAHLGAGAVTSNVKSDKGLVVIRAGEKKIETGRKKVGAMVGDLVEVGCGSVLNPGTVIGREIAKGKVGLMSDRRNHGDPRGGNGTNQRLVVKGPQILDRSSATSDNDHITIALGVQIRKSCAQRSRCFSALHKRGVQKDLRRRIAPSRNIEHIAHRRARRRGNDANALRKFRQRTLTRLVKEPLGGELLLQPLIFQIKRTDAVIGHRRGVNLITAAFLIDRYFSVYRHPHAIARHKLQRRGGRSEHDGGNFGLLVLQGKIEVSARMIFQIRDLTAHRDVGENVVALHQHLDVTVDLRDTQRRFVSVHTFSFLARARQSKATPAALSAEKAGSEK